MGDEAAESLLNTLAVLRRLFVLVYLSIRVLVVVVPLSRPVVADEADDADDDEDEDEEEADEPAVTFALGEMDDEDSNVTCWAA